jgi:hypothetical protein
MSQVGLGLPGYVFEFGLGHHLDDFAQLAGIAMRLTDVHRAALLADAAPLAVDIIIAIHFAVFDRNG